MRGLEPYPHDGGVTRLSKSEHLPNRVEAWPRQVSETGRVGEFA
jgi:hypothetical protein